jgi:hypothetical protein
MASFKRLVSFTEKLVSFIEKLVSFIERLVSFTERLVSFTEKLKSFTEKKYNCIDSLSLRIKKSIKTLMLFFAKYNQK